MSSGAARFRSPVLRTQSALLLCVALWAAAVVPAAAQGSDSPDSLTDEDGTQTRLSGFGVADLRGDGRTGANSFDAGKLAVGLFRELDEKTWVFGQLTTAVAGASDGDEADTEIEIDNLIVNFAPTARFSFALGKFDTPLGFERDDEPLNLQPTTSNNFELARPAKMVGAIGRLFVTPSVDVAAWMANGWQGDLEPDHGKTVGGRIGLRPSERGSVGLGFLYGPERDGELSQDRYLASIDYAIQPTDRWIIGGEANLGGNRTSADAGSAQWRGATATVFHQFTDSVGLTVRAEHFTDHDGARTGTAQAITSVSVAPLYFVGAGGEGIFATIEHTTFRIPRLQVRGEARWDHSTADVYETSDGSGKWALQYILQVVATF
jgi:hypothetical protein